MRLRASRRLITTDVVVVGSGGAALAALRAAARGLEVTVLECAEVLGGTTAVSGGLLWVPQNRFMSDAGIEDSRDAARVYLQRLSATWVAPEIIETLLDVGPELVDFLVDAGLNFASMHDFPDYRQDFAGASMGRGIETLPVPKLDDTFPPVRISPHYTSLTLSELKRGSYDPLQIPWDTAAERIRSGVRTLGSALVTRLVRACLRRAAQIESRTRAQEIVIDESRVTGVVATGADGEPLSFRARAGVVLGSGGCPLKRGRRAADGCASRGSDRGSR